MLIQHSQAASSTKPNIPLCTETWIIVPTSTASTATSPIDSAPHHVNHEEDVHDNSKCNKEDNLPPYFR